MDLAGWVVEVIARFGYLGIAMLLALESVVPPIPSEVVLPLAGFAAARGPLSLWGVVGAATVGSVGGALLLYELGRRVGEPRLRALIDRYGKWVLLDHGTLDRADAWFARHGAWAVFVGRLIPGVRSFVSVPAGVARMPMGPFLLYTSAGSLLWNALLSVLGHQLGANWPLVSEAVARFGSVVWATVGVVLVALVARRIARLRARRATE